MPSQCNIPYVCTRSTATYLLCMPRETSHFSWEADKYWSANIGIPAQLLAFTEVILLVLLFLLPSDNVQHDLQQGSLITFPREENTLLLFISLPSDNQCAAWSSTLITHHNFPERRKPRKQKETHEPSLPPFCATKRDADTRPMGRQPACIRCEIWNEIDILVYTRYQVYSNYPASGTTYLTIGRGSEGIVRGVEHCVWHKVQRC